jgi:SAM-dependent methyltransferase
VTIEKSERENFVSEYYGKTLESGSDLKTNACCAAQTPPAPVRRALSNVHDEILERFYGCGFPIPEAVAGCRVLDLGCGTGRDVYVLSQLVGEEGSVVGVDMTEEQLAIAKKHREWHRERFGYDKSNVEFLHGRMEDLGELGIEDNSIDVVVSNCVVNLSEDKEAVLREVHRVLKEGGEFYFSDVVVDRRLPDEVAKDDLLYAECLGGALYEGDFIDIARRAGFPDVRVVERSPIEIDSAEIAEKVGAARFHSVTYRLFSMRDLDAYQEDYGQVAIYRGGLPDVQNVYWFDEDHAFELHRPERVSANTASMLNDSRLGHSFELQGSRKRHFGPFTQWRTIAAEDMGAPADEIAEPGEDSSTDGSSCC